MRLPALYAAFVFILAAGLTALPAAADTASGLPTGKRQHKPLTIAKNRAAHRASAQRLKDARQRRAALKLIDALETAERRHMRGHDKSHRLERGRRGRTFQHNQTDTEFLKERARRSTKGGNDVAMDELTISHEGLTLVKSAYDGLRHALGLRTDCVRKCDARKRRCEAACQNAPACACVVAASDCLISEIHGRRCSTAMYTGWPAKVKGPSPKSDR